MTKISFENIIGKHYKLIIDEEFAAWADKQIIRMSGLSHESYQMFKFGEVTATSLTTLRRRIPARKDIKKI